MGTYRFDHVDEHNSSVICPSNITSSPELIAGQLPINQPLPNVFENTTNYYNTPWSDQSSPGPKATTSTALLPQIRKTLLITGTLTIRLTRTLATQELMNTTAKTTVRTPLTQVSPTPCMDNPYTTNIRILNVIILLKRKQSEFYAGPTSST